MKKRRLWVLQGMWVLRFCHGLALDHSCDIFEIPHHPRVSIGRRLRGAVLLWRLLVLEWLLLVILWRLLMLASIQLLMAKIARCLRLCFRRCAVGGIGDSSRGCGRERGSGGRVWVGCGCTNDGGRKAIRSTSGQGRVQSLGVLILGCIHHMGPDARGEALDSGLMFWDALRVQHDPVRRVRAVDVRKRVKG